MVAPTYEPSVALTPTTPPELIVGYNVTDADNKITLTIGNLGNQRLYNPTITIIGDDYELHGGSSGSLQDVVNTALAGLVSYDAGVPYIAPGSTFNIDLRLKAGKSPGTSYDGWVLFSADNLPDAATPKQFNIHVLDKFLPPPDLVMETPTDTVISGPFSIRAKFKSQTDVYPHYVTDLQVSDIFVDYGTVTAVSPDPATENLLLLGYYSDWIIDVTPTSGMPNKATISVAVKLGAAEDEVQATTRTVSMPKLVTFSSEGPYALFSVAEGAILSSLDTIQVYINGNGITPGKEDSAYVSDKQFTEAGALTDLQTSFALTQLPSTSLDIVTPGQYELSVTDENNLKIGSPSPVGFPNGDYELEIPAGLVRNYDGNYLPNTKLHFSIQMPEILDGTGLGGEIIPTALAASGGSVRIWVYGKHLLAAKGKLSIVFNNAIPGYTVGQAVSVPSASFTDTTAYLDVVLPANLSAIPVSYDFTIRLAGRLPLTDVTPDLTAIVNNVSARIDTTQTTLGYREGLHAWPHIQTFEGGKVDLKLVGENLFLLNNSPYSDLHIRVYKDGTQVATIPVATPSTLGGVVIPLGNTFTTEKNLSLDSVVYVFELWYNNGGMMQVPETSSGGIVSDSTIVKSGLDDLIQLLENTHHVVSQRVANTPPDVRKWLVTQLSVIEILQKFGLKVSEEDILFDDFDPAVAGSIAIPQGLDGRFVFTLMLHTVPDTVIRLNTGEITAYAMTPESVEREVILPEVAGYVTDPPAGDHHIESATDFTFYLVPTSDETRMIVPRVTTNRRFGSDAEGVVVEAVDDGLYYIVTIRQIREAIEIYINEKEPEANDGIDATHVWGESGRLLLRSVEPGKAVIYNTTGTQATIVSLNAGETVVVPLPSGIYIVALNGAIFKTLVK
jgi:hypothetical protein